MRIAIDDHAAVQLFDPAAGGGFAKTWNKSMEQTGEAGQKQRAGERQRHALMLEIILADGLGMGHKKPRKHGRNSLLESRLL